jgi:uncharacterized protein (TIGR03067 family)
MRYRDVLISASILALLAGCSGPEDPLDAQLPETPASDAPAESPSTASPAAPVDPDEELRTLGDRLKRGEAVDYVDLAERLGGKGMPAEDNAGVTLAEVFGTSSIPADQRKAFFAKLGIAAPDAQFAYVTLKDFAGSAAKAIATDVEQRLNEELDSVFHRPWSTEEFPELARWLDRNRAALDHLQTGAARKRCFLPMIFPEDESLLMGMLTYSGEWRESLRALLARATMRLCSGEGEAAQRDLIATLRWARHFARPRSLVGLLAAIQVDRNCFRTTVAFAQYLADDADRLAALQAELANIPALSSVVKAFDCGERLMVLDFADRIAKHGPRRYFMSVQVLDRLSDDVPEFSEFGDDWQKSHQHYSDKWRSDLPFNWARVLYLLHQRYDPLVKAVREPTRLKQLVSIRRIDDDLSKMGDRVQQKLHFLDDRGRPKTDKEKAAFFIKGRIPPTFTPETFADAFACLFFPSCESILNAAHRHRVERQLAELAIALERYRLKHGDYPEKLALLVPEQIDRVPGDVFSGKPFQYKGIKLPTGQSQYTLYSVGINEQDDFANFPGGNVDGDDLVVMSPRLSPYRRLLGAWEVQSAQKSGKDDPSRVGQVYQFLLDEVTIFDKKRAPRRLAFAPDARTYPRRLDWQIKRATSAESNGYEWSALPDVRAIYRLLGEGAELEWADTVGGKQAPKNFNSPDIHHRVRMKRLSQLPQWCKEKSK